MHHVVAGREVPVLGGAVLAPEAGGPAVGAAPSRDLLLAEHADPQPRQDEAAVDARRQYRGLDRFQAEATRQVETRLP